MATLSITDADMRILLVAIESRATWLEVMRRDNPAYDAERADMARLRRLITEALTDRLFDEAEKREESSGKGTHEADCS